MKPPAGMRTLDDVDNDIYTWLEANCTIREGTGSDLSSAYECNHCGSEIQQTTLYVSVHDALFGGSCAGSGRVIRLPLPYCPKCEKPDDTPRTCIHQ